MGKDPTTSDVGKIPLATIEILITQIFNSDIAANSKMFLQFDRREHEFTAPAADASASEARDIFALITKAQGGNHGYTPFNCRGFNDLQEYLELSVDGKVEISRIKVFHSDRFCMGVAVMYRVNGGLKEYIPHFSNHGYYSYHGGRMRESILLFDEDEYLCEVRTRQGDITDQITFCTNKRTVSFGGNGGDADPRCVSNTPVDLTKRVVAFVGTFHQVLSRLGTISILHNWKIIREFVLVRGLIERNRASPKPLQRYQNDDLSVDSKDTAVLQDLMEAEENIFRRVLSFLIANVETDQT